MTTSYDDDDETIFGKGHVHFITQVQDSTHTMTRALVTTKDLRSKVASSDANRALLEDCLKESIRKFREAAKGSLH